MPHFKYHAIFPIKIHIKVMQKFFLFFVKKLLTKFLSHSIISNVSGTRQNTKQYARVAQLVEHDLAKVGAAGSSPVSRSQRNKKRISERIFFSCFRAPPGLEGSRSPLRFGRCRTNVPRTFCNVSRFIKITQNADKYSVLGVFLFLKSCRQL